MTRHFYDIEKLSHTPYIDSALNNKTLYCNIVEHRKKFYHVGYVDYNKELPQNIQIVPDDKWIALFKADYNKMRESFIYGNTIDFDKLIEKLSEIQNRFRQCAF